MAALRYSRPGIPGTDLVIIGPANGRTHGTRYGSRGGPVIHGAFVTGESQRMRELRMQREAMARARGDALEATTPERRAQMAAYKAGKRTDRERPAHGQAFSIHPENRR